MTRKILNTFMAALLLSSCHGVVDIPEPVLDTTEALELSMCTAELTKAMIKSTTLPNGSSVGITVRDDYGAYIGELYTNVKYTSSEGSSKQIWSAESPIMLSSETGTAFAYYPYTASYEDLSAVPVKASSTVQTDYMWGTPVSVSKDSRTASFVMKHALAAVKISYLRGTYTGTGKVTKVSFGGNCIATAAYMNVANGSLSGITGKGGVISPSMTATTLSSTAKASEIIVIPTGEKTGKITITIDGKDYTLEFGDIDLKQGQITQFHLTVNSGEISLSDITVSEWTYASTTNKAIKVTDKVTLTGDLDNIAVFNSVSNGTVTITAVPKSPMNYTEVEPVTISGSATLKQSSDIYTGVRTITLSNISGNVTVTFNGTYCYDLVTEWNVTAGASTKMLYTYISSSTKAKILRIREGDSSIPTDASYTFSTGGKHILKYAFTDHAIPYDIFNGVPALTGILIGDSVTSIEGYAFKGTSIDRVDIPETVTTFGSGLFYGCSNLNHVVLPKGLTQIYDSMFRDCTSLKNITIPEGVTRFGDYAFEGCSALASIILPSGVTYVGNYCFCDCTNLRHIVSFPVSTPNLGGNYRYNFSNVARNGVLAVPAAAKTGSNYSYWVSSNINLGAYGWTLLYMD